MLEGNFILLLLAVALLALGFGAVGIYNRLVALRQRHGAAFAQIDVQLKRRRDLVPGLVAATKSYLTHESGTLEAVTEARAAAAQAAQGVRGGSDQAGLLALAAAESTLTAGLGRLFGLVEAYPELKASESVRQLTEELTTTENRIAFSRQAYNDAVQTYNTARESFPASLLASPLGFGPAFYLEIEDPNLQTPAEVAL
jgi:LemA protein